MGPWRQRALGLLPLHSLSLGLLSTKGEGAVEKRGRYRSRTGTAPAAWRSGAAWPRAWTGGLGLGLGHAAAAHRRHRPGRRCRGAGVRGGTAARSSAARPSRGSRPSCRRLPSMAPRSVIGLSTVLLPHKARPGAAKLMLLHASLALP